MADDRQKQLSMITDKEGEFKDLFSRMDTDADLAKRTAYSLKDEKGKKIPRADHVTLPKAAIFANRANALLSGANQQIVIEGEKLDDKKTTRIEQFLEDVFLSIDEYLNLRGMIDLFSFQAQHVNLRGRIAGRVHLHKEGDRVIPDVVPWDTRYVSYEVGSNGMEWASYLTTRSKAQIERDYEKTISGKKGKIRDLWLPDEEVIFLDNKHLTSIPHPWKEVPVLIQLSPAGLHLMDENYLKYSGESIFWLDRDLYDWANKCASIISTMNTEAISPAYQQVVPEIGTEKPTEYPGDMRQVIETLAELKLVPKRDLMNSTRMFWAVIDSHIQQGSFSTIEFGTLQFPLSAVALEDLAEGRHLVLAPGLQTLSMWYRQVSRMLIRQFIALGESASFGAEGKEREYNPKDLEGDYSINCKYFQTSKRQQIAGISEAAAVGNLVSDDYKRREMLQIEDPDGELSKIRSEVAEKIDPTILLYRQVHSLIDEDKQVEAQLVFRKLKRLLGGQEALPQAGAGPEKPSTQPLVPLIGKEGATPGGKRQGMEEVGAEEEMRKTEREVAS